MRAIRDEVGGHYRIAAVSDQHGEVELTTSVHPYWNSIRPPNDLYWRRLNNLSSGFQIVPAVRLDDLVAELDMKPPFLLKLDVQGAEEAALRGAPRVLEETDVVICEADIADFNGIHGQLVAANFTLYDLTHLARPDGQTLSWFYPIYLNNRLSHLLPRNFFREADNETNIAGQAARRKAILANVATGLAQLRAKRGK